MVRQQVNNGFLNENAGIQRAVVTVAKYEGQAWTGTPGAVSWLTWNNRPLLCCNYCEKATLATIFNANRKFEELGRMNVAGIVMFAFN